MMSELKSEHEKKERDEINVQPPKSNKRKKLVEDQIKEISNIEDQMSELSKEYKKIEDSQISLKEKAKDIIFEISKLNESVQDATKQCIEGFCDSSNKRYKLDYKNIIKNRNPVDQETLDEIFEECESAILLDEGLSRLPHCWFPLKKLWKNSIHNINITCVPYSWRNKVGELITLRYISRDTPVSCSLFVYQFGSSVAINKLDEEILDRIAEAHSGEIASDYDSIKLEFERYSLMCGFMLLENVYTFAMENPIA